MIKLFDGFLNERGGYNCCYVSPLRYGEVPLNRDSAKDSKSFCNDLNKSIMENGIDSIGEQIFDLILDYNKLAKTLNDIDYQMDRSADYMEKAIKNCKDISGAVKLQEKKSDAN